MKLHAIVGSSNSRKVLAVAHHLGIELEVTYLDVFTDDLQAPEFAQLNPNGMVPVLEDDRFVLWESNAIMQYLCESAGHQRLLPSDRHLRASVLRWQCWEMAHYNQALGTLVFETVLKPNLFKATADADAVARAQEALPRFVAVLEQTLADRDFLVADELTLADYAVAQFEPYREQTPFDWKPYPRVNAYYARMGANPHWRASAPTAEQTIGRRPAVA